MKRAILILAVCATVAAGAISAQANTQLFDGNGSTGGHTLSGTALFTTSANQVSVFLTNTTPVTYDAGELLTAVKFTIDGVVTSATIASGSATGRSVDGSGNRTDNGTKDLKALNTWSVTTSAGTYDLNFNPDAKYAIIGPAEALAGARYAAANSSIDSNNGHNPFSALSASFVLNITGVTALSNISNMQFLFGTEFETTINATPDSNPLGAPPPIVPEPAALWGGGAMLSVLAGRGLLKRRQIKSL